MTLLKNAATVVALILAGLLVGEAQITKPHTFADGETIDAARMNANFDGVYDGALNRAGGIMTGTLTSQAIVPSSGDTYDLGTTGTRFRDLFLSGTASITGALSAATLDTGQGANELYAMNQNVLTSSSPTFESLVLSVGNVVTNTSDGSDTGGLTLYGGGALSSTRGAGLALCGNENVVCPGVVNISAGNVAGGVINFNTANTVRGVVEADGDLQWAGRINSSTAQPGFLAYNSSNDAGVASGSTVDFDTEVYDTAGNFASDTFTAPVTGIYHFCATVAIKDTGGTMNGDGALISLVTSNRTYLFDESPFQNFAQHGLTGCVYVDMDANDTATVQTSHGVHTPTVLGSASPLITFFSGRLVP